MQVLHGVLMIFLAVFFLRLLSTQTATEGSRRQIVLYFSHIIPLFQYFEAKDFTHLPTSGSGNCMIQFKVYNRAQSGKISSMEVPFMIEYLSTWGLINSLRVFLKHFERMHCPGTHTIINRIKASINL